MVFHIFMGTWNKQKKSHQKVMIYVAKTEKVLTFDWKGSDSHQNPLFSVEPVGRKSQLKPFLYCIPYLNCSGQLSPSLMAGEKRMLYQMGLHFYILIHYSALASKWKWLFADTNYLFELYVYILIILYFMQRRLWIDLFILFLDLTHLEVEDMK